MLVIDLASNNITLLEDPSATRLTCSLVLYDSLVNSMLYKEAPMILVLDNMDEFFRKLQKDPLERYFPEYDGGDDSKRATEFIVGKLAEMNKPGKLVYPVFASCADVSPTETFCSVVREIMLHKALKGEVIAKLPSW